MLALSFITPAPVARSGNGEGCKYSAVFLYSWLARQEGQGSAVYRQKPDVL